MRESEWEISKMEDKLRGSNMQLIEILARDYKEVVFEKIKTEFSNLKQKKKKKIKATWSIIHSENQEKWINRTLHLDALYHKCGTSKDNLKTC